MADADIAEPKTVEDAAGMAAANLGREPEGHTTEAAEAGGLPQFQFQHWPGQIAYLLILFAILYLLMSRVFAPRIRKVFDERASTIQGALASARAVQDEAASQAEAARLALDEARARAQRTAADAKAKAAAAAAKRQAALEADLQQRLGEAERRIRTSRDAAMSGVAEVAAETAKAMFEKLTGAAAPAGEAAPAAPGAQG